MSSLPPPTERLRFRHFDRSDLEDVREMLADEEASRIFERVVQLPDYPERWINRNLARYRELGFGLWVLEARDSGAFLGDCGVTLQEVSGKQYFEVGYHLTLAARGRGFATEAARACLRYAFEELAAPKVISIVDVENPASRRVAERIHARYEEGHERLGRPIYLYMTERADFVSRS